MSKNLRFCFKVDKSVGVAEDELGNPEEAFICIKAKDVKGYEIEREKYKDMQEGFKVIAADQLQCDASLLTPVTLNEYLDATYCED